MAFSQSAPPAAAASDALDEVIVTGSRLRNPGMTSPTPLTVLTAAQFERTAPSSVDDVISQLPAFRNSSGPNQVQRNTGNPATAQSLADLRGLGSQRTLLLVDGQRWVPTNTQGTTSTSVIPVGLIDRVEVVTGGASAAYGSDAVAGVSNILIKDRIDGVKVSALGGISQHDDNKEIGVGIAAGHAFLDDRLLLTFGADYNNNKGIGNIYSRSWSAVEPGNSGNAIAFGANRPAGTAAFGWANGVQYAAQTPGGVINSARTTTGAASTVLNQRAFNPDGSTFTLVRGPVFGNLMINSTSNPIATPLAQWQLKQPLEQISTMGRATFDVNEKVQAFARVSYAWSNVFSRSQYHQQPAVTILATNPFLPSGLRTLMQQNNLASFDMGRVDTEWLGTTGDNDLSTTQVSTGLKGEIFEKFSWDLAVGYGESKLDSKVYGTREANLVAAEYAILDASGNIVCGPNATNPNLVASRLTNSIQVANIQPGCVPLNPFGADNASAAARQYVAGLEYTKDTMRRRNVSLNISGPLFQMPAGAVSAAAGAEYRRDSLSQVADALQQQGLYSSGNNKSYSGKEGVKEVYAEVEVPLLKDLPAVKALGLNSAVRRTKYDLSGSVTTWKFGATYEPFAGLRLRGTRSRDIRAPSLSDLYLVGGVSATGSFVNPFNGQSARLPVQTAGNPDLVPELADTTSVGATIQVEGGVLRGLRFSADYYRIKLRDVIASVGAADILQRCYQGIAAYCSAIQFDNSTYGIAKVFTQPFNQALRDVEGIDLELGYRSDLSALNLPGTVDISTFVTHLAHSKSTDRPGAAGVTIDNAGVQSAASKWVGSLYANYKLDAVTVGVQAKVTSPLRYSALFVGPGEEGYSPTLTNSINKNVFPSTVYFNLNGSYDFKWGSAKTQVFANINNLFDREPPQFAIAAINLGGNPYDYIGRTFKVGVRLGF